MREVEILCLFHTESTSRYLCNMCQGHQEMQSICLGSTVSSGWICFTLTTWCTYFRAGAELRGVVQNIPGLMPYGPGGAEGKNRANKRRRCTKSTSALLSASCWPEVAVCLVLLFVWFMYLLALSWLWWVLSPCIATCSIMLQKILLQKILLKQTSSKI